MFEASNGAYGVMVGNASGFEYRQRIFARQATT